MFDGARPPEQSPDEAATLTLDARQLGRLARLISVAVVGTLAETQTVGRSSYSIAEVAERAGVSEDYVRADVRRGLLRVVRLGGRDVARVLPEDEALWLSGRTKRDDPPAEGLSPQVVRRNKARAVIAHVLRKGHKVHRA